MKGDVTINGKDAYIEWGVNLEDGALSALMTPPPIKELIQNNNRKNNGVEILTDSIRYDKREITLPFHITANNKSEFFIKYKKFCNEVLKQGTFTLQTKYESDVKYRLVYMSCIQFTQYIQEMAIFSLKVNEPDPTNRNI